MNNTSDVTDASIDASISKGLTLVDFWAPWCAPCKALAPMLNELAGEYSADVKVVKLNSDENQAASERFTVRGLPTLILFKDGVECERIVGLVSKTRLAAAIDKQLEV